MRHQQGFTLIELSISLVIIALITGGVLIGNSLIRSAELCSVTVDVNKYSAAATAFKEKYRYLPGDLPNATDLWGTNPGVSTPGIATYNGNGDNIIESYGLSTPSLEEWLFWQHLADAGFIEGIYSGSYDTASGALIDTIGTSIPVSKVKGAGFSVSTNDKDYWETDFLPHHSFIFGAVNSSASFVCPPMMSCDTAQVYNAGSAAALSPAEAMGIDTKMDDGKPAFGKVRSFGFTAGKALGFGLNDCATSVYPDTAKYNLSYEGNACSLMFNAGF